jgi:hypothetical protein
MKLIAKVYRASDGSEWIFEKVSLPKRRGEYTQWHGRNCYANGTICG